jgi:hypothetical protein
MDTKLIIALVIVHLVGALIRMRTEEEGDHED